MTGRIVSIIAAALLALGAPALRGGSIAHAQSAAAKEASKHFQRGVTLYGEADYRAALVEFRKAYEISPNATVLYNIGQTYYQLQNYAAALTTLERYLSEAGNSASHRTEVEQTLDILQARVGKISVTANISPCEISIDDEHTAKTPLREPLLVSIGRRKVTAACEGRGAESKFVDIAAGDTAPVQFSFAETRPAITSSRTPADTVGKPTNWATRMWVATGVFGAGALVSGVLAWKASRDLKSAREENPVLPENQAARAADLSHKSTLVGRYSLIADIAIVATVVAGGIALKLTLSKSKSQEVVLSVMPNGIQIAGSFR
jgi:tetratricopeptide (TPR) repeat protein